jgi:hypothetical protein
MVSSSQIRDILSQLLDNKVDLDAFEDWLIQNTWNIHQSGSTAAEALTFAIEESLSEYSSGHLGEKELRNELSQVLHADTRSVAIADVCLPQVVWSFRPLAPVVSVPVLAPR